MWVSKYVMFCCVARQVIDFAGSVRKFGGSGDRGLERVFFGYEHLKVMCENAGERRQSRQEKSFSRQYPPLAHEHGAWFIF